jgi:hypothetical protein
MIGNNKVSLTSPWVAAGSITSEQAALAVTGRDTATADALAAAKIVKITNKSPGAYAFLFRFRADGAENLDSVLELYAARGTDHYSRIATLTITTGTQDTDTSTIHFVDKIAATNEETLLDGEEGAGTSNADFIDYYYVRTLGFDKFLFVCSDLDSTTVYIDYCRLYE